MCADCQQSKKNAERQNYSASKSCLKGSWGQCVMMTFAREVTLSLRRKWDGFKEGSIRHSRLVPPEKRHESGWVRQSLGPQELIRMRSLCVCVYEGADQCVVCVFVCWRTGCVCWRGGVEAKNLVKSNDGFWTREGKLWLCLFSSVAQLCLTLCDLMNHSMPGLPVHHQMPEFTQTHVHWVCDAIQPPHPLSSPSPPALNLSQHHGLFKWVSS